MDSSNDEYEDGADTRAIMEHGYAVGGYEEEVERHNSSSSENGDNFDNPPRTLPSPHNGHPQCPSSAGASDGAGRSSVHPWPTTRRTSRGGRKKVVSHYHYLFIVIIIPSRV